MKLTKKLKTGILKAYNEYWNAYLKGDMRTMSFWMQDNIQMIGSGRGEFFKNKKETIKYYKSTAEQVAGKADMRNRKITVLPVGNEILVNEECDFFVLIDAVWTFYGEGRISTLFTKTNKGWKIIQEHGSMSDARTEEGEQVNTSKIKAENIRLKDVIKRRTAELEEKNHELEIETALEKVRAVATGMHQPDDLLNVCEVMYKEFLALGFSETRNAVINIYNDANDSFTNYDYGEVAGKNISYFKNDVLPFVGKIIKTSKKKKTAFSESYISGKALAEFKRLRKKTGQKNDPKLNKAKSLYFYFYSIGIGTIGISTFEKINEEKIALLKRFRNVFALAYQRFIDIEKAEAQAREARIEAALERVRAKTMAMQKSEELPETSSLLFQQLKDLGQTAAQLSLGIINEEKNYIELSATVHGKTITQTYQVSIDDPYMMKKAVRAWKEKKKSLIVRIEGKELKEYNRLRNSVLPKKIVFPEKQWIVNIAFFSKGFLSFSSDKEISKETFQLLERFAAVFDLTYTRFLDLKKAEAQAREAEIELALERVRAKTMAMQKSEELKETTLVLFQQFKALGATTAQVSICIFDEEIKTGEMFVTLKGEKIDRSVPMELDKEVFVMKKAKKAFLDKQKTFSYTIKGSELQKYNHWRNLLIGKKGWDESAAVRKQSWNVNAVFFSGGMMGISSDTPASDEAIKLLERFANVFDLTFTRFLDLQKAEAQAREAEIELALERVRAKTMAMHRSEEIADIVGKIFGELKLLDLVLNRVLIWIFDDKEKYISWWSANPEIESNAESYRIDYNDQPVFLSYLHAWQKKTALHLYTLEGDAKKNWEDHLFTNTGLSKLPAAVRKGMREEGTIFTTSTISDYGLMMVGSFEPLSGENIDIIQRFGRVFQQSYTRYLDVQKAEAQAREAQIEIGLERVRSRAMAMQSSEELNALIGTVFTELTKLDLALTRCIIWVFESATNAARWWMANGEEPSNPMSFFIKYHEHPAYLTFVQEWKNQNVKFVYDLKGQDKINWDKILFNETELKNLPDVVKNGMKAPERVLLSASFNNFGGINVASLEPLSDEHFDILLRFAKVFDLTYTRFLDLKKAEAQAREAKIEAALEKVRGKAMAMHKSDDIATTASAAFEELKKLGINSIRCGVGLFSKDSKDAQVYAATQTGDGKIKTLIKNRKMDDHPALVKQFESWEKQQDHEQVLTGEELKSYYNKPFFQTSGVKVAGNNQGQSEYGYYFAFRDGLFYSWSIQPYSNNEKDILNRFRSIIALTFRRFLDLQKAEAQARESQIQLALERVRARTMAMQKSDELSEAVYILFQQFRELGENPDQATIGVINEKEQVIEYWVTMYGSRMNKVFKFPIDEPNVTNKIYKAWKENKKSLVIDLSGKELYEFTHYRESMGGAKYNPDEKRRIFNVAFFSKGLLIVQSNEVCPEESIHLLERFAAVFEQTYTRFLDLQKAEAQAREAQIEAALERVRSKTMAMHSSEDIAETVDILFHELTRLHVDTLRCGISIIHDTKEMEVWTANPDADGKASLTIGKLPMSIYPSLENLFEAWKNKESHFIYDLSGQDLINYFTAINNAPDYPIRYDLAKLPPRQVINCFLFSEGALFAFTIQPLTAEAIALFKRFATLFGQTYRRYLDLQKAEAQAREAKIEAAMEKVRARAMAMQKADELIEVAQVLRKEMGLLGVEELETSSIYIHNESTGKTECWYAIKNENKLVADHMMIDLKDTWVGRQMLEFYRSDKNQISILMQGANRKEWINYCSEKSKALSGFYGDTIPDRIYHLYKFAYGYMGAASPGNISAESWDLLQRATSVFSLAYTRFNDLQLAEASAKEAVKQAALDRIRADIASMRTIGDLNRIIPLIWNELTILGLPFIRCGVFLMDDSQKLIHTFLSTPEGKAIAAFHIPYNTPGKIRLIPENWRKKTIYLDHWDDADFVGFANTLVQQKVIESSEQYLASIPHGGFYLHFIPFLQGMLYVGNTVELNKNDIGLLESVADAFSTAYARYEDFNKLEAAKKQVDKTLVELKQAQQQLVQSEKMASLGEMTAGIAHEIQNPLNFVNNFSDVSAELLEEMKTELEKGNAEDAKALADDVIQNLEKILLHGKRADGIVKSMLQHSRASSGKKELTDINALCDEYLRLSFHGLRAKDKSFNAKFETDFDESLPKVNVVPQDIGRVILNLINNAFYAVSENQKLNIPGYEPTVVVKTTKNPPLGGRGAEIEVRVKDNGGGIPQKVLDKIFQPFFTTKPTGQGTGLGLSLSYDIITKGHNGELKVETKEREGSEFIVLLPI